MSISQRLIRLWRKRTGIVLMLLVMSIPVFIFGIASAEEKIQPVAVQLNEAEPKEETPPVAVQVTEVPAAVEPGNPATGGATSVELNGDTIEYSMDGNKVTAEGNVVIFYKDVTLTCDHLEFSRDTSIAHAKGNVRLLKGGRK